MCGTASASGAADAAQDTAVRSASVRPESSASVCSACVCLDLTAVKQCCLLSSAT